MNPGILLRILPIFLLLAVTTEAADEAKIKAAIDRGRAFLTKNIQGTSRGGQSLAAYALLKSGTDKNDAVLQPALANALDDFRLLDTDTAKVGVFQGQNFHESAYTVACHMFLLESLDSEKYKPELQRFTRHLIATQLESGAWCYTGSPATAGDTSQTQFAILGLWAAQRAEVDVSPAALEKATRWFLRTQLADGGFCYQPWRDGPEDRNVKISTTLAGISCLLIVRHLAAPNSPFADGSITLTKRRAKRGVLQPLEDAKSAKPFDIQLPLQQLDSSVAKAVQVADKRLLEDSKHNTYVSYASERMSALLQSDQIGNHDWYQELSDRAITLQLADGSWNDLTTPVPATSFAILALSRATAQILGTPGKKVGGGLLAGARGLPGDLSKLTAKDAAARKSKGAVDDLLGELENVQDVSVADVQRAILESVDLDKREELVGQIERLKKLAGDPRAEVRRTIFWAMGRSGDVRLAPDLIKGLKDVDADVIREASFGLTVLSRKPTGIVDANGELISVDPFDGLDEDATEEARQQHLEKWLARAETAWKKWYFSVRPYDERDDRQTFQRKK